MTAAADRPAGPGEAAASALNAGLATSGDHPAPATLGSRQYPVAEPAPGRYAKQT